MKKLTLFLLLALTSLSFGQGLNGSSVTITTQPANNTSTNYMLNWDATTKKINSITKANLFTGYATEDYVADAIDALDAVISAVVQDAINNGETAKAPSQNAVYDALQNKQDLFTTSTQGGTTYTFILSDANSIITCTNAAEKIFTIPLDSSVPFPLKTKIVLQATTTNNVKLIVDAVGGVTINAPLGSETVEIGDTVRALVDSPSTTPTNWAIQQNNIGYTAENSANKTDTMAGNTSSSTKYLSTKGTYDYTNETFLPIQVAQTTGVSVTFTTDRIYGSIATPETGNITANVTGAKLGVTNIIIHNNGTTPTFGSEFKKLSGSGDYVISVVNYIYCTYITSTEIIYSINQRT